MKDCIEFDQAYGRLEARVEAQRKARQDKWKRIKTEAPEIADFLTEINAAFGKPARVRVEISGERVV